MAIIQINDVFEHEERKYRILAVEPDTLVWFELNQRNAWPALLNKYTLLELVEIGEAYRIDDPFVAPIILEPSLKNVSRRDNAYETIRHVVEHPFFYDTQVRIELSNNAKKLHGTTDKVINKRLKRYWTYGQSKNALYPRYANSGAPGQPRTFTDKRSGRPRVNGTGKLAISTEDVRRLYRRAIEQHHFKQKRSFSFAFRQFKLFYLTLNRNAVENEIPTEPQMRHFYNSQYRAIEKAINKTSSIAYRKDVRSLTSTSTSQALGPGSRYEIDATTADIYVVSDYDGNRVIGRPTLYILIDVFSRMVAGFSIGFKPPSYITVIGALVNAAMTKEESLKEIDETNAALWPVSGLPEVLLADKGSEFFGKQSNNLLDIFTVHIENAPAYRGEAKGIVEHYFHSWQAGFKNVAEGIVTSSRLKKAGEDDYRTAANVSVSLFRQFMISGIVAHNNLQVSRSYDRASDIPDDLEMTPINLWNWGIKNRTGSLRTVDKQQLIAGLLPKAKATSSELGLCFSGIYYNVQSLVDEGKFLRKGFGDKDGKYAIAYNPDCMNTVYVFINNRNDYVLATLHPRSRQFADLTLDEIKLRMKKQTEVGNAVKQVSDTTKAKIEAHAISIFDKVNKQSKLLPPMTDAAKIAAITENKKQAQRDERLQNSISLASKNDISSTDIDESEVSQNFSSPTVTSLIKQQRKDAKS